MAIGAHAPGPILHTVDYYKPLHTVHQTAVPVKENVVFVAISVGWNRKDARRFRAGVGSPEIPTLLQMADRALVFAEHPPDANGKTSAHKYSSCCS